PSARRHSPRRGARAGHGPLCGPRRPTYCRRDTASPDPGAHGRATAEARAGDAGRGPPNTQGRGQHMRKLTSSFAAIVFATLVGAPLAGAQDKFFKEATPAFDNCNDGSLARALKDGVTLGFSPIPPHSWINAQTKEAEGIDVEIHKAVLDWIGIKQSRIEWMPWESQVPALLSKRTD